MMEKVEMAKVMKRSVTSLVASLALIMGVASAPGLPIAGMAAAFAQDDDQPRRSSSPSLSPTVAKGVQEAIQITTPEGREPNKADYQQALSKLNSLISQRGDRLQGYDKAIVYQVRGQFKIELEDNPGALRDFQTAIDTRALPPASENGLRYAVAQLHFSLENYDQAISGLNQWIQLTQNEGKAPPANAYYLLGLAYVAKEDYRRARQPMERALQLKKQTGEQDKNYYNVLNLIYSELNDNKKRASLLEEMINIWPDDAAYWKQLAGAYAVDNQDRQAFSVLEVAYRAGLLSKEDEVIQLIQYYSFFENAYRGAVLLEREMAAGTVRRNEQNLILLSQLWDQSREAKKAIPILREAAESTGKGELFFRLGRVLVADEQFVDAETALQRAIRSGQLKQNDLADAYMLLGNARFARAGPDDVAQRNRAREAFVSATRYPKTRRDAQRWVGYIDEVNKVQRLQDEREKLEQKLLCDQALERLADAKRVIELRGGSLEQDLSQGTKDDLRGCGYDINGDPLPGSQREADAAAAEAGTEENQTEGDE
ncbi:MAG: tetratricopeptide repeat protein [Pseudomonadota bacterium]